MNIIIKTIPHKEQRYDTVGDYFTDDDGTIQMRISELGDNRMNILIAIHELYEKFACQAKGITDEQIDEFDINYDGDYDECGQDPSAPYHQEHMDATEVEKLACEKFGFNWEEYDKIVMELE